MSIEATVHELADSPKRSKNRATRRFLIVGPETLADAKYVTINPTGETSYCPTTYDGLFISDYSVEEIVGKPGYYIAEITYGPLDLQEPQHEPGDTFEFAKITVNFTTKGQTTTRFYGFSDNNSCTPYVEGDESKTRLWQTTQHGAFVGVTEDEIQGVEVIIPTLEFTVTKEFPSSAITMAQVRALYSLTGTVNADKFLGFSPGELLYKGVDANYNDGKWSLTYEFAAQPNVSNLVITAPVLNKQQQVVTGVFEVGDKKGWDYLWMEFININGPIKKMLKQINVVKVYPEANFRNNLGI